MAIISGQKSRAFSGRLLQAQFAAQPGDSRYAASIAAVAAGILLLDILIPLGVAGGVPYIVVVLLAARTRSSRWTRSTAIACTGLIGAGFLLSPDGGELWKVVANRLLAVIAVWVTALLSMRLITETIRFVELARVAAERSRILTNVSHELKTPLTSLLAFTDILARNRNQNLTERQLQQVDVMRRGARRLDVVINDLLDMSSVDAGKFAINREEFDAGQAIEEALRSWTPILDKKGQTLVGRHPAKNLWLNADRIRVIQVVTNLLSNASKYSGEGAEISVQVEAARGELAVSVDDSGIGMSRQEQTALFTPLFRADTVETRSEDGTGLGLVIVKTIVESHGGEISFVSEPGKGSTFRVTFPNCADTPSQEYLSAERTTPKTVACRSRLA